MHFQIGVTVGKLDSFNIRPISDIGIKTLKDSAFERYISQSIIDYLSVFHKAGCADNAWSAIAL